jgi:hypothetical protein
MKCEIVVMPASINPQVSMAFCQTHNMPLGQMPMQPGLCPVGQVKQAVEDGLAIIRAARDELK